MLKTKILFVLLFIVSAPVLAESPDFSLPDTNGKIHHLSDYRGKWVVLNYWATWCPPCLEEIPELEDFYTAHHKRDAVVVGINYEEVDTAYLKSFIEENMISYPVLRADLNRPPVFGRLLGLPTSFIVSPEGKLVKSKVGTVDRAFLEDVIKQSNKQNVVVEK